MDTILLENYQRLLNHYGNKHTDFDLFFQNYEGLFVFSRIDIVFTILTELLKENIISVNSTLMETGSGDGRIVALASMLGFKTYGMELSNDMKNISLDHLDKLEQAKIITERPLIVQGDFLDLESYKKLNCSFQDIDIFFNYYTNTEMLVTTFSREAKKGALLISVSLSKRPVKTNSDLIISSPLADHNHYLFVYRKI